MIMTPERGRKRLLDKLLRITVQRSIGESTATVLGNDGEPVVLTLNYDVKKFGFPPNRFVKFGQRLLLCLGVGQKEGAENDLLYFLDRDRANPGAFHFKKSDAAYFAACGFELLEES